MSELTAIRRVLPAYEGVAECDAFMKLLAVVDLFREQCDTLEWELRQHNNGEPIDSVGQMVTEFVNNFMDAVLDDANTEQQAVEKVVYKNGFAQMHAEVDRLEEQSKMQNFLDLGDLGDHPF
jgi:hypothetical protein